VPTFAVHYEYDTRRDVQDAVRPDHRAFVRSLLDAGTLLASGPLRGEPAHDGGARTGPDATPPGALLIVRAPSADAALRLLDADPFREAGVVVSRSAREWDPVTGPFA
jgi:uncharacterized protein